MVKKIIKTSDGPKIRDTKTGKLAGSVPKKTVAPTASPTVASKPVEPNVTNNYASLDKKVKRQLKKDDWVSNLLNSHWNDRATYAEFLEGGDAQLPIFELLSNDEEYEVREALLFNHETPTSVITAMWNTGNIAETYIVKNPNTSDEVLAEILEIKDIGSEALGDILKHPNASELTISNAKERLPVEAPIEAKRPFPQVGTPEFKELVKRGKAIVKEKEKRLQEDGRQRFPDASSEELEKILEQEAMDNYGNSIIRMMKGLD